MRTDETLMREALKQAAQAAREGEIPVGAVLIDRNGDLLAAAHNLRERTNDPMAHAEVLALREAAVGRTERFFTDCTLYVTLEPCPMCAGALIAARVGRVVFGAVDPRAGAFGSLMDLTQYPLEHRPQITGGVLADECIAPLRAFFAARRRGARSNDNDKTVQETEQRK